MAAAISALNAKIRSQPVLNYVFSTRKSLKIEMPRSLFMRLITDNCRFLGPSLQFRDTHRSGHGYEERSGYVSIRYQILHFQLFQSTWRFCHNTVLICAARRISGKMTAALTLYSGTFMRYSMAVTPKNYLLFACHFVNFGAQLTQGYRYVQYWQ